LVNVIVGVFGNAKTTRQEARITTEATRITTRTVDLFVSKSL
jgi:hypothetical protein